MDILDSALEREISLITGSRKEVSYFWQASFHANEKNIDVLKVISVDIQRDYENTFSDVIILNLAILGGVYAYDIIPYLSNLELTLYQTPLSELGEQPDSNRAIFSRRYKAMLIQPEAASIESNNQNQPDRNVLDLTQILQLNVQLSSLVIEQLRVKTVGGIYRKKTNEDILKNILTQVSKQVEVLSEPPLGVQMQAATNKTVREHTVIEHNTKLTYLPQYLHEKCGGIYNAGFSYYYQSPYWFVFAPYDIARENQNGVSITFIRIPSNRLPGIERTFRIDGSNIVILVTGEVKTQSLSEKKILNEGNGTRFSDANLFMGNFVQTKNNTVIASRGENNNEMINVARQDGVNHVMVSDRKITANPYLEYSKLAARQGDIITLSWENSDPELITPGVNCNILYLEEDEIKEIHGLVIHAHHYVQAVGPGLSSRKHICTSNITLFCRRAMDSA